MSPGQSALMLALALAVDWWWGEPPVALHPVCWMGRVTRAALRLAPDTGACKQFAFGLALAAVVPGLAAAAAYGCMRVLEPWPWAQTLLGTWWLTSAFAWRGLGEAGLTVHGALVDGDLVAARYALRALCSRDARALEPPLLVAATVESLAENASDSLVAPLLFFALGGVPAAVAYRAVNTLDAMVGYRGKYEYLGKAAARLDDLLNLVPARLTALLLLVGGAAWGADLRQGLRMWRRDGYKTASPNAGHPMATMAGLLRIELEKLGCYRLGEPLAALTPEKIPQAWRIVCGACLVMAMGTVLGTLPRIPHWRAAP